MAQSLSTNQSWRLAGRSLPLTARQFAAALWGLVFGITLALGAKSAGSYYHDLVNLNDFDAADRQQIRDGLARMHLSVQSFAVFEMVITLASSLISVGISLLLIWKARIDWFVVAVALMLLAGTQATYPPDAEAMYHHQPVWVFLARCITLMAVGGFFSFPLLFPNGRFVPKWLILWEAYVLFGVISFVFWPDWDLVRGRAGNLLDAVSTILLVVTFIGSQIYRYRRTSSFVERQQTKMVIFGLSIGLPCFFIGDAFMRLLRSGNGGFLAGLLLNAFMTVAFAIIPVTIGLAILRFRLYDVDLVISRTVVWVAMSALVIAGYALVVVGLGSLLHMRSNIALSIIATGIVAVAFQPVRAHIQRGVNRLLFGDRDDPYAVAQPARAAARIDPRSGRDPAGHRPHDDRSPPAPLCGDLSRRHRSGARWPPPGTPVETAERIPLTYQSASSASSSSRPRTPGEAFGPSDRRLLEDLARQVGVAAHSVSLAADLQRSRERIVSAREEERRRLRRDLHDGLGAQLAALSIQAGALRLVHRIGSRGGEGAGHRAAHRAALRRSRHPPPRSRTPAAGPRRSGPDRRPSGASHPLRRRRGLHPGSGDARRRSRPRGTFHAPETLPQLPAALEVALYRIVDEALTNVSRHASACNCAVRLEIDRRGAFDRRG